MNEDTLTDGEGMMAVLNAKILGDRFKGARWLAGFDSHEKLAAEVTRRTGHVISGAQIGRIERGEVEIRLETAIDMLIVLDPPEGIAFLAPAVDQKHREMFNHLIRRS
jgi:hypothetical protein